MVLFCHLISHDHVIKASCGFIGKRPSRYILPSLVAIVTLIVGIYCFQFVKWSWFDDVTRICRNKFIWVNSSKYTCLPNLEAVGFMEIKISILISIFTWMHRKKLNSLPRSTIVRDIQNQEYRFTISKFQAQFAEN